MRKNHSRLNLAFTKRGFSLVELSIVLVILGLLVGGVLSGQSLIRAAELRSVSTEYNRYYAALQTFRDKYFAMPGDMNNATRFWGRQNSNADCVTNSSAAVVGDGVCDGNGNAIIEPGAAASQSGEIFQLWRQLAKAGLIEGNYTGTAGSGSVFDALLTQNTPASKLNQAGWGMRTLPGVLDGSAGTDFTGTYGTYFLFGAKAASSYVWSPVLKPEEQWNIDTKIDDGKPATGKLWAGERPTCTTASAAAAGAVDYAATYALNNSSPVCKFYIRELL